MNLAEVADDLYAEPPARFIAERAAAVKRARSEGDRELAAAVGRLPKPSVAAWAVNTLARERGALMDGFASLGRSLRDAQDDLDPDALRTLTAQRRALIRQLAAEAQALGEELGQTVSAAARQDIEQTLQAALADSAASDAIRSGRLTRSLSTTGFDPVDLDGALAGGQGAPAKRSPETKASRQSRDELEEARQRKAAELEQRRREKADAESESRDADAALRELKKQHDTARAERDELRADADSLRRQLEELEDRLTASGATLRTLRSELDDADDSAQEARRVLSRAAERLAALDKRSRR